jgi:hypothetical protein
MAKLFQGARTRTLDARPDRVDFRDRPYQPRVRSLPPRWPLDADVKKFIASYNTKELVLDQGEEGACSGFGLACVINFLRWTRFIGEHGEAAAKKPFLKVSPHMLYQLARRYDEWPGERYEGSSCRGALKGWHKHGVASDKRWPGTTPAADWQEEAAECPLGVYYRIDRRSVVDMQSALYEIGAIYVSASVHDGWDNVKTSPAPASHKNLPVIAWPKTDELGGHAFAFVGYNETGFVVQNSWGPKWGAGGFAVLPYEDWVEHGDDAWAAALGVPVKATEERKAAMRFPMRGRSLASQARDAHNPDNPAEDPWPVDHDYDTKEYQPWSTAEAYEHTLVTGNDGCIEVSDLAHDLDDAVAYARHVAHDLPLAKLKNEQAPRLMVFAHGGLNAEAESIGRIRMLAPYFAANGVYPLFLTWKTGPIEVLLQMLEDFLRPKVDSAKAFATGAVRDQLDRLVEPIARTTLRGVWTEMRENAQRGLKPGHGLDALGGHLFQLKQDLPKLEVHLVGHSAGAILLGHLLEKFQAIASCHLLAPACSVRFARQRYLSLPGNAPLVIRVLSDENERADGLPKPKVELYGKSLLYLVSRALDDVRKMPLLGFERAAMPEFQNDTDQWDGDELPELQAWLAAARATVIPVKAPRVPVSSHEDHTIQATHGSFDNNVEVISEAIKLITGAGPKRPVEWLDY